MITFAHLAILCLCFLAIYDYFFVEPKYYHCPKSKTVGLWLAMVVLLRTATDGHWYYLTWPWYFHSASAIILLGICCRMNDMNRTRMDDDRPFRYIFFWLCFILSVVQFTSFTYGPLWPIIVSKLGTP